MKNLKTVIAMVVIAMTLMLTACSASNEPCDYCGNTPSKGYKVAGGEKFYVCSDCSSECAFCGEKATKQYTAMLGNVMFVCTDCYNSMSE